MSFDKKHVDCFIVRAETKFHGLGFNRIMRPLGEREGRNIGVQYNINIVKNLEGDVGNHRRQTKTTEQWSIKQRRTHT